jgi:hypothetical protein
MRRTYLSSLLFGVGRGRVVVVRVMGHRCHTPVGVENLGDRIFVTFLPAAEVREVGESVRLLSVKLEVESLLAVSGNM